MTPHQRCEWDVPCEVFDYTELLSIRIRTMHHMELAEGARKGLKACKTRRIDAVRLFHKDMEGPT